MLIRTGEEGDLPDFAKIGTESTVTEIAHPATMSGLSKKGKGNCRMI